MITWAKYVYVYQTHCNHKYTSIPFTLVRRVIYVASWLFITVEYICTNMKLYLFFCHRDDVRILWYIVQQRTNYRGIKQKSSVVKQSISCRHTSYLLLFSWAYPRETMIIMVVTYILFTPIGLIWTENCMACIIVTSASKGKASIYAQESVCAQYISVEYPLCRCLFALQTAVSVKACRMRDLK